MQARIEALGASGDARAIEPLKRITLNNSNYSTKAALALQHLVMKAESDGLEKSHFANYDIGKRMNVKTVLGY